MRSESVSLGVLLSLLEKEWARWRSLAADPSFKHTVSGLNGAEFLVQLPSGKQIVYRVEAE